MNVMTRLARQYKKLFFKEGDWAKLDGEFVQVRAAKPDFVVLQKEGKSEVEPPYSTDYLYEKYMAGQFDHATKENGITFMPRVSSDEVHKAERYLAYIHDLLSRDNPGSPKTWQACVDYVSERIDDKNPPSPKKVYRLTKDFEQAGHRISQVLKKVQRRASPMLDKQFDLAMEVIDDEFLVINGGNISHTYKCFEARFAQSGLKGKPMSKTYFRKLIDTLDPYEVCCAQRGKDFANRRFRASDEKISTHYMMERVEIDAVHLSLGLIDDETGEVLGKVIVFLAIDVHTRSIVSYSLAYGQGVGETADAAIELVRNMLLTEESPEHYRNTWHRLGIPMRIHSDNGAAFVAENFVRYITSMGLEQHRSETKKSQRRPFIERFNRTLREQLACNLPGYQKKRVDEVTYEKTVEEMALLTVSEFKGYLEEFIVDIYHQPPHKGLHGLTPQEAVEDALDTFIPRPAPSIAQADAMRGVVKTGVIQQTHGIQIDKQHFNSPELRNLRAKLTGPNSNKSPTVKFIYNAQDISQITVLIPNSMEIFVVPNRDKTIRKGTSIAKFRAQIEAMKMRAKARRGNETAASPVFENKQKQHKPKRKSKKKKSKAKNTGANNNNTNTQNTKLTTEQVRAQLDAGTYHVATDASDYKQQKSSTAKTTTKTTTKKRKKSKVTA